MKNKLSPLLAVLTFIGVITVNTLANTLPINNTTTGDISDSYPNLFAPASLTFSIWGLIYAGLTLYTAYQTGIFSKELTESTRSLIAKINPLYIVSSVANILWIFSWHYRQIGVSVFFMLTILYCLVKIADIINKQTLTIKDNFFIRIPFSIYFGWITVATIANVTTFLVSINWNGFGLSDQFWTVIVILIGALIGITRMLTDKNKAYGLVLIWAYLGIYYKHLTVFMSEYLWIMYTVVICIFLFIIAEFKLLSSKRDRN